MPVFSGPGEVEAAIAATERRSRYGSTRSSFASARALLSWMPLTPVPDRSPTAIATASSSSSSSGGSVAPTPSR